MNTTDPEREFPPLPEPATFALFEGRAMQGSEIRKLSNSYEPGCAQYTADQMHAYVLADRALAPSRETAPAGPELSDEQIKAIYLQMPTSGWSNPMSFEIAFVRAVLKQRPSADTRFVALRAKGVLDADDNLDCWDTPPFDLAEMQVRQLNEKDPGAMWRVAQLYVESYTPETGSGEQRPAALSEADTGSVAASPLSPSPGQSTRTTQSGQDEFDAWRQS